MRTENAMQLKAIIRNRAEEEGVTSQLVMQNYLLERLLERISLSSWRDNVVACLRPQVSVRGRRDDAGDSRTTYCLIGGFHQIRAEAIFPGALWPKAVRLPATPHHGTRKARSACSVSARNGLALPSDSWIAGSRQL